MMMSLRSVRNLLLLLMCGALVSGCAIKPTKSASCGFVRRDLAVSNPVDAGADGTIASVPLSRESLAGSMTAALSDRRLQDPVSSRGAMLFLSGGSQNGAFAAGLLDEWHTERKKLPTFDVVTGISTGSILATFAFVDRTDAMVKGYTIESEADLLRPYVKGGGKIGPLAGVTLLRTGAIADLVPLRSRLDAALTDEILEAVKRGGDAGRRLFIGAVDVGTGEAVAFDMTEMAARWVNASGAERPRLKRCYVEAVLASSSAPIAAPPVFIDNRMYIDGGARFGVFSDEVGRVLDERVRASGLNEPPPRTYVIMNGSQAIADKSPPPGPHPPYTFLDLALRSEGILANQVYRFSADKIAARARTERRDFFFAKIDNDMPNFQLDLDGAGGEPMRTCSQWSEEDERRDNPLQFHRRFMRCLIGYGRARAHRLLATWDPEG